MKTIIAGPRSAASLETVEQAVESSGFADEITEMISSTARGAGCLGELWASHHKVPLKKMSARWGFFGRWTDRQMNVAMARYAAAAVEGGCLIAIRDGKNSHDTTSMIELARRFGLRTHVYVYVHETSEDVDDSD